MFARIARLGIVIAVTAGIFYVSASHIIAIAERYGNHGLAANIYPLTIDGVILISALTLVATQGSVGKDTKRWATGARYFGFAATIYANVEFSGYGNLSAIVTNLIPAIGLIFTMEIVVSSAKAMARQTTRQRNTKARQTENVIPMRRSA